MSKFISDLYNTSYKRSDNSRGTTSTIPFPWESITERTNSTEGSYSKIKDVTEFSVPVLKILGSSSNDRSLIKYKVSGLSDKEEAKVEMPKLVNNVLSYLMSEEYTEGEISKTHLYLMLLKDKFPQQFPDVFQQVWLKLFRDDSAKLRDFICIAAGLSYSNLKDRADALILGAFAHTDEDVNEAGIRAVESWGVPDHYELVSNLRPFNDSFLEEYKISVLEELRGES